MKDYDLIRDVERRAKEKMHLSRTELSARLGVSRSTWYRARAGENAMMPATLRLLLRATQVLSDGQLRQLLSVEPPRASVLEVGSAAAADLLEI
jgi:transcriptional regulator with XRE-family HTH domain